MGQEGGYPDLGVNILQSSTCSAWWLVQFDAQVSGDMFTRTLPRCWCAGPQFANRLDQLLEQVDSQGTQVCATEHIEVCDNRLNMSWVSYRHEVQEPPVAVP